MKGARPADAVNRFARARVVRRFVMFVAGGLGHSLLPGLAHADMTMPGQFKVNSNGAATYTIPIQAPPGIGGMEPSLSLSYNSHGGNGSLGVGWALSGLSSITRCPRTGAQDSVRGTVAYDANDRFCLDGKRLMVVSGTYGAAGSEYRTELETFTKVTAYGAAAGGGPTYFIAKTRAGLTTEYGHSTDSSIEVAGKSPQVIRAWALNKVTDTKGNTLTVNYFKDTNPGTGAFDGGFYPSAISYGSNSSTGLAASALVSFAYEFGRIDTSTVYQGGYAISNRGRLTTISTASGASSVMTYALTYEQGPASGRSRIIKVSQCAAGGACLPPTEIAFPTEPTEAFQVQTALVNDRPFAAQGDDVLSGDFAGDGRQGFVAMSGGAVNTWLPSSTDPTGFVWVHSVPTPPTTNPGYLTASGPTYCYGQWLSLDLNADGRTDLVHILPTTGSNGPGEFIVYLSNGDGTFKVTSFHPTNPVNIGAACGMTAGLGSAMDINGDGRIDIQGGGKNYISNGDGTFTESSTILTGDLTTAGTFKYAIDINGDGLTDLVFVSYYSDYIWVWKSNGDGSFFVSKQTTGVNCPACTLRFGDFNGDGLPDIWMLTALTRTSATGLVLFSKGDGSFASTPFTATRDGSDTVSLYTPGYWASSDLNGDGLQDIIYIRASGQTGDNVPSGIAESWISNGKGGFSASVFQTTNDTTCPGCGDPGTGVFDIFFVADSKGEGYGDLFHYSGNAMGYWTARRVSKDLPNRISTAPGNAVTWSRDTLPKLLGDRYVREKLIPSPGQVIGVGQQLTYVQWPQVSPVSPLAVVTDVMTSTGIGATTRKTSYSYGTALIEGGLTGRGFLGFNWQQAIDVPAQSGFTGTGLVTRTYFRQDFPYIGMVDKVGQGTSLSAWNNLAQTGNTYGCASPNEPAAQSLNSCSVVAGNGRRYFLYPSQIDTQSWDLNGVAFPRTSTQNSNLDAFGNIQTSASQTLNPDGSSSGYSKTAQNNYYNDASNWYLGRLTKSVVTNTTGSALPSLVVPGSGSLPATPSPTLPAQLVMPILQLLLDD